MDVGLDLEVKLICLKSGNANAKNKTKKTQSGDNVIVWSTAHSLLLMFLF